MILLPKASKYLKTKQKQIFASQLCTKYLRVQEVVFGVQSYVTELSVHSYDNTTRPYWGF